MNEGMEVEERKRKRDRLREVWRAPRRHVDAVIEDRGRFCERRDYLVGKIGSGMVVAIIGVQGRDKTQLGVEVMRAATEAGIGAEYWLAAEIFMRLKACFRDGSEETEWVVVQGLRRPGVLVIDEVGKRGHREWENVIMQTVIDQRYQDKKDTLLVGNLDVEGFRRSLGDSIMRRAQETGGLIVLGGGLKNPRNDFDSGGAVV